MTREIYDFRINWNVNLWTVTIAIFWLFSWSLVHLNHVGYKRYHFLWSQDLDWERNWYVISESTSTVCRMNFDSISNIKHLSGYWLLDTSCVFTHSAWKSLWSTFINNILDFDGKISEAIIFSPLLYLSKWPSPQYRWNNFSLWDVLDGCTESNVTNKFALKFADGKIKFGVVSFHRHS